jgi:hypothetical protein
MVLECLVVLGEIISPSKGALIGAMVTCHLCRWLLGSEGTAAPTSAGPSHLSAAAVCSPGAGTFNKPYF